MRGWSRRSVLGALVAGLRGDLNAAGQTALLERMLRRVFRPVRP